MISFQNLSKKAMRRASLMILQQSRSEGETVFFLLIKFSMSKSLSKALTDRCAHREIIHQFVCLYRQDNYSNMTQLYNAC
jgi:hypothetical protein